MLQLLQTMSPIVEVLKPHTFGDKTTLTDTLHDDYINQTDTDLQKFLRATRIVTHSGLGQAHSFFRSELSRHCDLVLRLPKFQYLIVFLRLSSNRLHPLLLLLVPSIFSSETCFRRQPKDVSNPASLSFFPKYLFRTFLFSMTLCNTSSFFTQWVHPVFSFLL